MTKNIISTLILLLIIFGSFFSIWAGFIHHNPKEPEAWNSWRLCFLISLIFFTFLIFIYSIQDIGNKTTKHLKSLYNDIIRTTFLLIFIILISLIFGILIEVGHSFIEWEKPDFNTFKDFYKNDMFRQYFLFWGLLFFISLFKSSFELSLSK